MKIAVLGAGHMGRWLISELAKDNEVGVYDVDRARTAGLPLVTALADLSELASFQPELLLNAVSLRRTIEAFEAAAPYLPAYCLLCDVASVKGEIPAYYLRGKFRFASVHPMFGPTFANVNDLRDEHVIIIRESDPQAVRFFKSFFSRLELSISEVSFAEHDRMIAYSLALPFASTLVFAACMERSTVPGTTFKKHLEIARGLLSEDDYLLAEVIFGPHSLEQLEKVTSRLEFLKHVIKGRDFDEARVFFARLRQNIQGR
jgi:prephenate dehydrogenase